MGNRSRRSRGESSRHERSEAAAPQREDQPLANDCDCFKVCWIASWIVVAKAAKERGKHSPQHARPGCSREWQRTSTFPPAVSPAANICSSMQGRPRYEMNQGKMQGVAADGTCINSQDVQHDALCRERPTGSADAVAQQGYTEAAEPDGHQCATRLCPSRNDNIGSIRSDGRLLHTVL